MKKICTQHKSKKSFNKSIESLTKDFNDALITQYVLDIEIICKEIRNKNIICSKEFDKKQLNALQKDTNYLTPLPHVQL